MLLFGFELFLSNCWKLEIFKIGIVNWVVLVILFGFGDCLVIMKLVFELICRWDVFMYELE